MILNPRQRQLLELVQQSVTVSVEDLARELNCTPQTVRRDVKQMAEAKLLARYHGGVAQLIDSTLWNRQELPVS